jgi:hypothetical protein
VSGEEDVRTTALQQLAAISRILPELGGLLHEPLLTLEIIRRLCASRAAGATSLRGIWGFHGDHAPHGDRPLRLRRGVPVVM